ncbi:MAG TPA: hypothetical protein PLL76_22035 [Thermoanaerobaculia bacterium]|jgi:hypothetical protein|nr:hypothetical protein [Thermoanaerobaculia bacterium]
MRAAKLTGTSASLGRAFHADAFLLGAAPTFLALMFGGSGVSEEKYRERATTIVPAFDGALSRLERAASFAFVFVTAPYDVPFARFEAEPDGAARWNRHVCDELLPLVDGWLGLQTPLPRYLIGYSGGAALALSGHHLDPKCYGAGMIGADGLVDSFERGPGWSEPLTLYYNLGDGVFEAMRTTVTGLEDRKSAQCFRRLPGGHELADYVSNESFGGLIRRAERTAPLV